MTASGWKWIEQGTDFFWPASLELLFAATLVLLMAMAINLGLCRAAASVRHRVWALTMGGLLLLPLLCPLLPKSPIPWSIPITATRPVSLTPKRIDESVVAAPHQEGLSPEVVALPTVHRLDQIPPRPSSASSPQVRATSADPRWGTAPTAETSSWNAPTLLVGSYRVLMLLWTLGTGLCLVAMARSLWAERRLAMSAFPLDDPSWQSLLDEIGGQLGVRRAVAVGVSQQSEVPLTIGWCRPKILLPPDCSHWTAAKRQVVLIHELSHVARHDVLWQVVAQLACTVYWFHPLAWLADRRLRVERELACDDAVLRFGGQPDQYATVLLEVAAAVCHRPPTCATAVAMACRNSVERRIRAILQPGLSRLPVGPRQGKLSLLGAISLVVLTAALHPFAPPPQVKADSSKLETVAAPDKAEAEATKKEAKPADKAAQPPKAVEKGSDSPKTDSANSIRPGCRPMQIHVFDSDRKPLADARITVRCTADVSFGPVRYRTDTEGNAGIEVPKERVKDYQILALKDNYVTAGASWRGDGIQALVPEEFTFTLEQGTIFGGIVRDEQGEPIVGAEVTVEGRKTSPDAPLWVSINDTSKTDAEGKWQVHRIPKDLAGFDLQVRIKRPDVAGIERFDMKALPIDKVRARTAEMILRKGIAVEGTVTDPQGKPAATATVGLFAELSGGDFPRTKTDENGHYRFAVTEPGEYTLAAAAKGYAPDSHRVTVATQPQKVDLQLRQGEMIRLRVVDKQGEPMPGVAVATVFNNEYREALMFDYQSAFERDNDRHMLADAEGRWSRLWIPNDEITLLISKPGYDQVEKKVAPRQQEYVVTLEAVGWSVAGRVVDQETKAPITKFCVVEGDNYANVMWRKNSVVENSNGEYRAQWNTSGDSRRVVRIEADGHLPSETRLLRPDERAVTFNVELNKGADIVGLVRGPDGKPLAESEVALCSFTRLLSLRNGRLARDQNPLSVRTGPDGRFTFAPQSELYILIAMHDSGYARIDGHVGLQKITLEPWARVEGTLRIDGGNGAKEQIRLHFDDEVIGRSEHAWTPMDRAARYLYWDYQTQTDDKGHFVFERVRSGKATISRNIKLSQEGMMSSWTAANSRSVEFVPGQTVTVTLAGSDSSAVRQRELAARKLRDAAPQHAAQDNADRANRVAAALKVLQATPPATQDDRIEAAMEILKNYSIGTNEKSWATAIRELIATGKPAVPKLTAELDRSDRNETLRALGFVLRGIGDPRAVPALIRAIPRLYGSSGSDCGLFIKDDPELTKFMEQHDNSPGAHSAQFHYGRPIREVMPALEKLTGQSHGWLDLNFADREGQGAEQQRIKRIAFLKHAERWADWWSKNWQKFLANEADAQLPLTKQALDRCAESIAKMPHGKPLLEIPCGPNVAVGGGASNYWIKSFDESPSQAFLDFDSGRQPSPPKELVENSPGGEPSKELLVWAEQEGVDLITVRTRLPGSDKPVYAFKPVGMKVWRIDNARFDHLQNELCSGDKSDFPDLWHGPIAQIDEKSGKFDDKLTVSFLFITKEGVCGAIQLQSPLSQELVPGMRGPNRGGWHYKFIYERGPEQQGANE
jgi:beta-lactamase regulating signal transducer with metallopeptidase domain